MRERRDYSGLDSNKGGVGKTAAVVERAYQALWTEIQQEVFNE